MESEIGAVVALAAMSGGKGAPAIAMSTQPRAGGEDAGPRRPKPPAFVAATPFRAPAPVQMTPRAPAAVLLRGHTSTRAVVRFVSRRGGRRTVAGGKRGDADDAGSGKRRRRLEASSSRPTYAAR